MGTLVRRGLVICVALMAVVSETLYGARIEKDLEGIKKKIEKEKRGIFRVQKREGSIIEMLETIDGRMKEKNRDLKKANTNLDSTLAAIRNVEAEMENIRSSLDRRKDYLKKRALALYRWNRGGSPFVVFDGASSLGGLMQHRRYLEMTLAFDRELIETLSRDSARQEALKKELTQKSEALETQRRALLDIRNSIRDEGEKKRQLLASVRREKEARVRALKELEQAALRLHKMMDEISKKSQRKIPEVSPGAGLEALKGNLDLPVGGAVKGGFGKTRHPEFSEEVFRKGIDIEAPLGEEIKSVAGGTVVFADHFSGYGNMLIIDHGERYYSVYAHLSELLKKSGDSVRRGEAIGRVGDSDSLSGARLYFEIRKDGRPVDPLPWFRKR